MTEADTLQRHPRSAHPFAPGNSDVHHREGNVFEYGAVIEEMERLKDEADPLPAQYGAAPVREARGVDTIEVVGAAGRRVEEPEQV
jgi:hypothetical protein